MNPEQWSAQFGERITRTDAATIRRYCENVSGLQRRIAAVLYPESTTDVQGIVRTANEFRTPLHPISTGCNWGLGSKLPVRDGAAVVDLSRMDRIHEVNERHGYAVVEPGVTQRKLYEQLKNTNSTYFLSVTGSGPETSVLGNALDRGIAHHGPRAEAISGLEVVLGNGELIRTGSGHFAQSKTTYLYRHGVGPSLDGLFCQSNFGIVTKAAIGLIAQKAFHGVLGCTIDADGKLPALVDGVAALIRLGILEPSVHLSNHQRTRSVVGGILGQRYADHYVKQILDEELRGAWSLSCPLSGTPAQVKLAHHEARAVLRRIGEVTLTTDRTLRVAKAWCRILSFLPRLRRRSCFLDAIEPSYLHSKGIPSDTALASIAWPLQDRTYAPGTDLDATHSGALFVLPVVPLEGEAVRQVMEITEQVFASKHGFIPYVTLNSASRHSLEAVINLLFRKNDPKEVDEAHRCVDELVRVLMGTGYVLYRAGIQSMGHVVDSASPYWQMIARLKDVFDPNHIIAPGRYNFV
jgi:4-cresol dehydrogenase (hydroxylating)